MTTQTGFRERDVLKAYRMRLRRDDGGSIAVLAAVIIPVVLLVIALALATLVWGTSETETQRASDQAALQSAASVLLVPNAGLSTAPAFPTLASKLPPALLSAAPLLSTTTNCKTLGDVYTAVQPLTNLVTSLLAPVLGLPTTTTLNSTLSALDPSLAAALKSPSTAACSAITVLPDAVSSTYATACGVASAAMSSAKAPWSNSFYGGTGPSVPDCATNQRVTVSLSDGDSTLLDLGGTSASVLGSGPISATSVFNSAQTYLASMGVRLNTVLPNSLCPKVTVSVEQPVKGPVFGKVSEPSGRSTAKRVIKNAVIVPVFNGVSVTSPSSPVSGTVTTPPVNLNTTVLAPLQKTLLGALDAVNATINQTLAGKSLAVSGAAGATVGQLDLLQCVRDTVADLFNPPTSGTSAPTSQEIMNEALAEAAATGDPVQLIQVGVRNCTGATAAVEVYSGCIAPALGTVTGSVTGLYDVPFLDVTPAIVSAVGSNNFQAVPVAATQASGAFRAVLVRSATHDRYLP